MKASVISEMTTEEVRDKVNEESEMFAKMKMSHAVSPLENPLQLRIKRRTIARLKTELNKRSKAEQTNQ